jgi:hypothetical protein
MAKADPLKKLGEKIGKEVAEGVSDIVKKATKPKPKVERSTSPTRKTQPSAAVTPTPKADLPSTKVTPSKSQPRKPRKEETAEVVPAKRAERKPSTTKVTKSSKAPSATPAKQSQKTKPTSDLEAPKAKKSTTKRTTKKTATSPRGPVPGVTTVPTPPGSYLDDAIGDEFALARAADEAIEAAAPGIRRFGGVVDDPLSPAPVARAAEEAVTEGIETAARRRFPRPTKKGVAITAGAVALPAVEKYERETGTEADQWLKNALAVGSLVAGGAGLRGIRAAGKLGKFFKGATAIGGAAIGLPQLLGGGQTAPAEAVTPIVEEQVVTPEEMFPGYAPEEGMDGPSPEEEYLAVLEDAIDQMTEEADSAASSDAAAVESKADQALAEIIAMYGGEENTSAAAAAGDPILLQQLAAIEADYQAGMTQISNNYGAALTQINGYTQQANTLYNDLASKQAAAFESTAGALESGGIPLGLTAGEAAMSGVSDTALGGAGITGAALTRMLGEAGQAGIRADQGGIGIDLGTAAAEARLGQADLQAALGRDYLGAKSDARTAAAERAAAEREAQKERALQAALLKYEREVQKEQEAADKSERDAERRRQIAQWNAQTQMDLAEMVANMTAEEYARWKGSSAGKGGGFKAPSWYGKTLKGDPNQVVGGLKLSTLPATVQSVNDVLDIVYATMSSESARNPATALVTWQKLYESLDSDTKKILASRGIPTTATGMYKELFKSAPSK